MADLGLFDEPYRVSINDPSLADGSRNGLLLGLIENETGLVGLVLLEDGSVTRLDAYLWTVDFRYDVESDRWVDQTAPRSDQQG